MTAHLQTEKPEKAVVIGVSAGGLNALSILLPALPKSFSCPILIVQHRLAGSDDYLCASLNARCLINVKEAEDKEIIRSGCAYFAPADYHLLVERDGTIALSVGPKENYSRPSIDVLFESASYAWSDRLTGILLTGANHDGAKGIAFIKQRGGTTIVQDPDTAEVPIMPRAGLETGAVDHVLSLQDIAAFLNQRERHE